jgi:hypothetical protein
MLVKSILVGKHGSVVTIEPTADLTRQQNCWPSDGLVRSSFLAPIIASSVSCRSAILCAHSSSMDKQC